MKEPLTRAERDEIREAVMDHGGLMEPMALVKNILRLIDTIRVAGREAEAAAYERCAAHAHPEGYLVLAGLFRRWAAEARSVSKESS